MFIWQKNKENFEGVAESTAQKFTAVIRPNKSWPEGLRQESSLASLKHAYVEWLHRSCFALRINDSCQQRNPLALTNSAYP